MMIKPGISELSKCVDSRYTLVTMAAKRARMIGENKNLDDDEKIKPVSRAIQEIADGRVQYCRGDEVYENNMIGESEAYANSEPSSELNLEALRVELEALEKKAIEEARLERERLKREGLLDDDDDTHTR